MVLHCCGDDDDDSGGSGSGSVGSCRILHLTNIIFVRLLIGECWGTRQDRLKVIVMIIIIG